MKNSFVLDTHVFFWLMEGNAQLSQNIVNKILTSVEKGGKLYLSAISIWEIGMLVSKGRITLREPTLQWVQEALSAPYIYLAPLSPEIAIESCNLPGVFHADPSDRLIVASARILRAPLLTRDERIIQYAKEGYIEAIAA